MSDLRALYQELIVDHSRKPRNFGVLDNASHQKEGFNPLCGDRLTVYLKEHDGTIDDLKFEGCGCAISMASASLMTEALKGKTVADAEQMFTDFHNMVTGEEKQPSDNLGKLIVMSGVSEYPARVKCASLAWHTLKASLEGQSEPVSTE